ncbi:response regulator [Caballeronia sp. LZ025]|uniref:response regulator n=1 Tax=Caballeronia TaxID=1827195 RepID=UPI001FD07CD2|nr:MULTISPECIES: response regulator [Caballeronia]MDR5733932.1 response regulator [Caballeronia sp. LZ025]
MPGNSETLVLIVEDEPKLAAVMSDYLRVEGYSVEVLHNGLQVVPFVRSTPPALILLDLMLPGLGGLDVCRELRTFSDVPVIMLTARVDEIDRLLGLESGADDYVCKPFSPREVVARVKAILRRTRLLWTNQSAVKARDLTIDADYHRATLDGKPLKLTPIEFRLLHLMHSALGRILPRAYILENVYSDHRVVTDRTIDSHIKNLRRKLQDVRPESEIIISVYGVGYKLEL